MHLRRRAHGNWRGVVSQRGQQARSTGQLAADLGGIAEGFGVDVAVASLPNSKGSSALVNASGDPRAFGLQPTIIHLRHTFHRCLLPQAMLLHDAALAASAPSFTERRWQRHTINHLVNPHTSGAVVRAYQCWFAEALTEVVLDAPVLAEELLERNQVEDLAFTA